MANTINLTHMESILIRFAAPVRSLAMTKPPNPGPIEYSQINSIEFHVIAITLSLITQYFRPLVLHFQLQL